MQKFSHFNLKGIFVLLLALASLTVIYNATPYDQSMQVHSEPKQRLLSPSEYKQYLGHGNVSYLKDVKPILDSRCVVCHGCYDSPCQLKLSSIEGLDRGASKIPVYDTKRLIPAETTRLFIDEVDTEGWRKRDFFPVLDEGQDTVETRVSNSVLAGLLELKRNHPLPGSGKLSDDFEFKLDRTLECPTTEEFPDFKLEHPMWGMPYAMPGLAENEEETLVNWLKSGAKAATRPPLSSEAKKEIEKWEKFFNGNSFKEQLVSRYLYEHLYLGHLHFTTHPANEFYYLVRSTTPPGQPIDEINTVRPYDDPGSDKFYYRLRPIVSTIVDKNHYVYELNDQRLQRFNELFFEPDYVVTSLPSYDATSSSNPFKTFIELPLTSRYQFLLDDAVFFFSAFIKGPVCRGQVAVNVIRDQFWVAFIKPDKNLMQKSADFLSQNNELLTLPAAGGDQLGFLGWYEFDNMEQIFLHKKDSFFSNEISNMGGSSLDLIWDGNGNNPNAALTVFRHYNSATVTTGFIGSTPLTGWIVDYPIFERIYYLLVAGFNVYGSSGHQIATRKYMDFMRVEAENNFLRFVPEDRREVIHRSWYRGVSSHVFHLLNYSVENLDNKTDIQYTTTDHKKEFFDLIQQKLGDAAGTRDILNGCTEDRCVKPETTPQQQKTDDFLRKLSMLKGLELTALPEVSFLRIKNENFPENDLAYTLIRNTSLSNVAFMFVENLRRQPEKDTLTVVPGLLGSYPNIFLSVKTEQFSDFIEALKQAQNESGQDSFYRQYGIRRSNPEIWEYSDWFYEYSRKDNPIKSGIFDLNRYKNL